MTDIPPDRRPSHLDGSLVPGFTGSPLDRVDAWRQDPAAIMKALNDPRACLLRMEGLDPLLDADGALDWGHLAEAAWDAELALLGLIGGIPRFVALTPAVPHAARRSPALNGMLDYLEPAQAATYAAARSLIDWHARHRFCANCGTPTTLYRAGWGRRCPGCRAEHFPRTDPVVIMLAEHAGCVLVGRQRSWPTGRYSALAGFVEVGESIEEAVARELAEEAGVVATSVRYLVSQPWPFPSQLMVACIAPVADAALHLDQHELEDAFWATREDIRAALAAEPDARFIAPPPYAVAHTLFARWLAEQAD
ncbi:NAD(+) diphosphatase [Sphingomonas prati]|uniref:NAD(+) diphosphatase n=1 Tax=Sphingomonas prati TaxID=1843237 RepID=A0A7W9BS24_9SPHN|nr:NAD(+) diphosphatase [Sphingomonas prati]MBB5729112.1 NAD+ diphosphatase [Sphingomonas prati]GGE84990.1 NADH pyrophosphatase [Sphingomonas prati]